MALKAGGILAVGAIDHDEPSVAVCLNGEGALRCGVSGAGCGADHGFIGDGIVAVFILRVDGYRIGGNIDLFTHLV